MKTFFYPGFAPMPYESIFSIYLKISRNNYIPLVELAKRLGGSTIEGPQKARWQFSPRAEDGLREIMPSLAEHLPWTFTPMLALTSPASTLNFCDECIRFGYHSVFNSIELHGVCPLHKRPLSTACLGCKRRYLKGFVSTDMIPYHSEVCSKCGFQEIGARQEIQMRRAPGLIEALRSFGEIQSEWYKGINYLHYSQLGYSDLYYKSKLARSELSGCCEAYLNIQSPESLSGLQSERVKIICVGRFRSYMHDRLYSEYSTFALGDYMRLHSQSDILLRLKGRFLCKHLSCLEEVCRMVRYPDGQSRTIKLCPLALSYVLLCIKASDGVWPTSGSDCHQLLSLVSGGGFAATWISSWTYREAVLVFLTILARLEYYTRQKESFVVICRPDVDYFPDRLGRTLVRKSSHAFRSCCQYPNSKCYLTRNGAGGALEVFNIQRENPSPASVQLRQLIV
jgi:hypothetical protein